MDRYQQALVGLKFPCGRDPVWWTPRRREFSSWEANVGSSLLNKDVVAKLAINTGRPVEIVARELGSDERTLGNRVKAYRSMHEAGVEELTEEESAELVRLRKFELMRVEKNNFTIKRMATLLEISRPGSYAWLARKPSDRAIRIERFEQKAVWSHGASDGVFGPPKILADLHEDGVIISRKTVAKVVRRLGFTRIRSSTWWALSAFVVGSPACQIADKHRRSR